VVIGEQMDIGAQRMKKLLGKNVLITGGTQGLGLEIAKKFITEGANVLICSRNIDDVEFARELLLHLITSPNQLIKGVAFDVSKIRQANFDNMMYFLQNELDILVNNAGVNGVVKPSYIMEEYDWKQWKETMNINFIGSAKMARYAIQYMLPKKSGKIIQLSGGGATSPREQFTGYASSKTAIVRFMETLALELKNTGIDINCVSPGLLPTRLGNKNDVLLEDRAAIFQKPVDLITFLASDESNGISGKLISAQWDRWDLFAEHKDEIMNSNAYTLRRITGKDCDFEWDDIS
jgi:NAD(P)-dependent dehydrogenase (short-subunit alcohol dehydrogenase family)